MKRREFLQCAAVLAAGATAIPNGWSMNAEQKTFLAARRNYIDSRPLGFFTDQQRATITAIAEHIIPATDTPGATAAGVPRFIELMIADWFNDDERTVFMSGLADLENRAGGSFSSMSTQQQLSLLEKLEGESSDASWYKLGNFMRVWDDTAPFICQLKEFTVLGFFLSEVGASQALRTNPMGSFDGDIPLQSGDSAYATGTPIRIMAGGEPL